MDVCPVGAITTRDYRFKSRPWDNPDAVDTICTLCSKGCNTTAWIKAKPEWAKGAQLVRFTPRYEPAVNGYWMCDIGRFDYHWIEGESRLTAPLVREGDGHHQSTTWDVALKALADRVANAADRSGVTFLMSAHASNEEIFLVERLAGADRRELEGQREEAAGGHEVQGAGGGRAQRARRARSGTARRRRFVARPLGVATGGRRRSGGRALRLRPRPGRVDRRYVVGRGGAAVGQGAVARLPRRPDDRPRARPRTSCFPDRPGSRKTAPTRTTRVACRQRRVRSRRRAMRSTTARSSCGSGRRWGRRCPTSRRPQVREAIAQQLGVERGLRRASHAVNFARPVSAKHWLQASNPSERWKWDFMFQEVNEQKWDGLSAALPQLNIIPLTPVQNAPKNDR